MKKCLLILVVAMVFGCKKSDNENPNPLPDPEINNTEPTVPLKVFPTNGLLCTENPLEFRWNSSTDKEGDAVSYEIEIASDAAFTNIIERTTVSTTSMTFNLLKGVELNWRLRAKDSKDEFSEYSPNWKFYTEGEGITNYVPFTPTLIRPILNTEVTGNTVSLEWSSSDVDGDSLTYDVYFGGTTPPTLLEENQMETSYDVTIETGQTYYWKVIVKDGNGGEAIGEIWQFKS